MTFLEFVTNAPTEWGADPAYGRAAELVFLSEKEGDPAFHDALFETPRDRAAMLVLWPGSVGREATLDVIELAICSHRQFEHGEDHRERIGVLSESINDKKLVKMATRDWWIQ